MTGCDFEHPGEINPWLKRNRRAVEHNILVLNTHEKKQKKGDAKNSVLSCALS